MSTIKIVRAALIAAVYVVLSLVFAPFSFGAVQLRVSEALVLLPVICPEAILGVTLGCFISNTLASSPVDMVVGTLATLLAACFTYLLRNYRFKGWPVLGSLPPILINAVAIGVMLTVLYTPGANWTIYAFNMLTVGAGQVLSCAVLGILLVRTIEKTSSLNAVFKKE